MSNLVIVKIRTKYLVTQLQMTKNLLNLLEMWNSLNFIHYIIPLSKTFNHHV